MRVIQSRRAAAGARARRARRWAPPGAAFEPARGSDAGALRPTRGPAPVNGVEALVALQGIEGAGERRRRAIRQGCAVLDRLDELKVALLSGRLPPANVDELKALVSRYEDYDGEPELAELLRQIDLRARVELAKRAKSAA